MFEMFLDDKGQKISKSKGNGITIERMADLWLAGKPGAVHVPEAAHRQAALFRRHPQGGGRIYRLSWKPITRRETTDEQRLENPVWHIHGGKVPDERYPVSFALLLNLVSASNAHNRDVLWGFIRAYAPEPSPQANPGLDRLVGLCAALLRGFREAGQEYSAPPDDKERAALEDLAAQLEKLGDERDGAMVQNVVYEVGKAHGFEPLRAWFAALYEVLLGQTQGPRFGSFAALFGCAETAAMIRRALAGEFLK